MKKILYFATTNEGKIKEAQAILSDFKIHGCGFEIEEIQSLDETKVAVRKAQDYNSALEKPVFVEDLGLFFKYLNGLPGTYINDFLKVLGNDGLARLIPSHQDRSAKVVTAIVFCWGKDKYKVFKGEVKGTVSSVPMGNEGFGWDPIFIPQGQTRTFGQMSLGEKNKYSMRAIALGKFAKWLQRSSEW